MSTSAEQQGAAARLQAARVAAGFDAQTMAERLNLTLPSYRDLEMFDDEMFTCLSLEEVVRLADLVGVAPLSLLVGDAARSKHGRVTMPQLIERVRQLIVDESISEEAFSNRVGWDIAPALAAPATAWRDWNVDCLRDVCAELEVEWIAVLAGGST